MSNYALSFLLQFSDDLNHVAEYISSVLKKSDAAYNLIDEVERAIYERQNNFPESYEKYPSKRQRQYPYYRIYG